MRKVLTGVEPNLHAAARVIKQALVSDQRGCKMAATVRHPLVEDRTISSVNTTDTSSYTTIDTRTELLLQETLATSPAVVISSPKPSDPSGQIAVGGHRGLGQNFVSEPLQLHQESAFRENTIGSFLKSAETGASFIEFDVQVLQVTRDGVPVVWHDDAVVYRDREGSINSYLISEMTHEHFKQIEVNQLLRHCQHSKSLRPWRCSGNTDLPTLEEVFRELPEAVGFDLEVKMTTPDAQSATSPEEVDRVVTAVLREVREWEASSYRRIIFSTFDPDVALALKRRQSSLPVMFLADGQIHYADQRRCGLEAALKFASEHRLDGLVLESFALKKSLDLVERARRLGLHVLTYGVDNDDPAWVLQQQSLGIQAAIVDDVQAVVQGVENAKRSHA